MAYQQEKSSTQSSTTPDPASVHVLYAGNLADDDFMWIVECTIEEFQKMLGAPVAWVKNLSTLPDWHMVGRSDPAPPPVLLDHFTMRIQQREKDAPTDLITIQGISYTGIISVRASYASAVVGVQNLGTFADRDIFASVESDLPDQASNPPSSSSPFSSFWNDMAYDASNGPTYKKKYAVNVDTTDARYYGHFEVCPLGTSTASQRLAQAAAFILALGSDPQGCATMLNSLDQTAIYVSQYGAAAGSPIKMAVSPTYTPQILYTSLDDATDACCFMLDGNYTDTTKTGLLDNPVLKKYGVNETGSSEARVAVGSA